MDIEADTLDTVLARATWLGMNAREAELFSGGGDVQSGALPLFERAPALSGLVIRDGAQGCDVYLREGSTEHVASPTVVAVDTNGAGDVHVGAFLSALARGEDHVTAARSANEAAAVSVTRLGPATAPRLGDQGVEST